MKTLQYWVVWIICFLVGYVSMKYLDAPGWAAVIGGWVVAFGTVGKQPSA